MFEELIQALDAQNLKPGNGRDHPGESIGLKKLCAAAGLSLPMWAERLRSVSIGYMIQEELQRAGYVVKGDRKGDRRTWSFSRLS